MSFNNFTLELLNRKKSIFVNDLEFLKTKIKKKYKKIKFLSSRSCRHNRPSSYKRDI